MATVTIEPHLRKVNPFKRSRRGWTGLALGALLLLLLAGGLLLGLRSRKPKRVANETVIMPLSPPNRTPWRAVEAIPQLRFREPTEVVAIPGMNRWLVLERQGTLQAVSGEAEAASKEPILDFRDQVLCEPWGDDGAIGLVLHPQATDVESTNRGFFYVYYTADVDGVRYDRLSRFTANDKFDLVDRSTETVLIDQVDRDPWHNGGGLAFGPDGFLYVGMGDEGGDGDPFGNGQRIDRNLFCGILRIDVNRVGGSISHAIVRQPRNGRTDHYFVPNDNPFVGQSGSLEEFWSVGFRNPYRFHFDPDERLWVGDVGQNLREEINIATSGSNHGWSYQEGNLSFDRSPLVGRRPAPFHGHEVLPVHSYPHTNNNGAVIGGFVYQGNKYPELRGKYLYGDNTSGRIWAFSRDENNRATNVELLTVPATAYTGISSLAADADGEVLVTVLGDMEKEEGRIYRIEPAPPGTQSSLPSQLSDTGIFTDLESLEPSPGFIPYEVNVPAWSDGAVVRRWVLVPGDGSDPDPSADRVEYAANGPWTFPVGTVFVQHFELPVNQANPSIVRRLETRILVCHAENGVYGVSYRWNEEGSEAVLVDNVVDETILVRGDDGDDQELTWTYADSQTCLACHNQQAGFVLGVNTRQLNRDVAGPFGFGAENQLLRWTRGGLFTTSLNATDVANGPRPRRPSSIVSGRIWTSIVPTVTSRAAFAHISTPDFRRRWRRRALSMAACMCPMRMIPPALGNSPWRKRLVFGNLES